MNTMKRAVQAVLASGLLVLGLGLFQEAQAGTFDTMTITVSAGGVSYAVAITSPEAQGYDFAQVNIGLTTISTLAIAVRNAGTISEFFSVGVVDVTATYAWTNNPLTPANTSYVMQALFTATGAAQPAEATFTGAAKNVPIAAPVAADSKFGQGAAPGGRTLPGSSKDLWLRLGMPTGVEETGVHTMVLTVNGQSS